MITPTMSGTGLFDPAGGIELPDTATGSIAESDPSSGANIIIITYDLELTTTVSPQAVLAQHGDAVQLRRAEGATDHTTVDRTDDATVAVAAVTITKARTEHQSGAYGEPVRRGRRNGHADVVVRVPEGETAASSSRHDLGVRTGDCLAQQLDAFVRRCDRRASAAASRSVLANAQASASRTSAARALNNRRRAALNFGTLTNINTDDSTA